MIVVSFKIWLYFAAIFFLIIFISSNKKYRFFEIKNYLFNKDEFRFFLKNIPSIKKAVSSIHQLNVDCLNNNRIKLKALLIFVKWIAMNVRLANMYWNKIMRKCPVKLWLNAIKRNCYNLSFQLIFAQSASDIIQSPGWTSSDEKNAHAFNSNESVSSYENQMELNRLVRRLLWRPRRISFSSLRN